MAYTNFFEAASEAARAVDRTANSDNFQAKIQNLLQNAGKIIKPLVVVGAMIATSTLMQSCGSIMSGFDNLDKLVARDYFKSKGFPIHSGKNPPNIEGTFVMSPVALEFNSDNRFAPPARFSDIHITYVYSEDKKGKNVLSACTVKIGNDVFTSDNVTLTGEGDKFTTTKTLKGFSGGTNKTYTVVISGVKDLTGIRDIRYGLREGDVIKEQYKNDKGEQKTRNIAGYRILKDNDGRAESQAIIDARARQLAAQKAEQERLAAIEKRKQDSIAAIEKRRLDSIATVERAEQEKQAEIQRAEISKAVASGKIAGADLESFKENKLVGYKHKKTGQVIIPAKYVLGLDFHNGIALVSHDGLYLQRRNMNYKCAFIDPTGKELTAFKYNVLPYDDFDFWDERLFHIAFASPEFLNVRTESGGANWGLINIKTGKEITPFKYQERIKFDEKGFAKVKQDWKFGIIDKSGKEIVACKYDLIDFISISNMAKDDLVSRLAADINAALARTGDVDFAPLIFNESGIAMVKNRFGIGLINNKGVEIVTCGKYEQIRGFFDGLAAVKQKNGLWGFINTSGREVISCKYHSVNDFVAGYADVIECYYHGKVATCLRGKNIIIDKTGKVVRR